jgi:DNA-binding IclR family transcriptional regulator
VAGSHRTVDRIAAILEHAAASPDRGVSLADVAGALDAPKSSIHGLIGGLLHIGYLLERSGRYYVGPGVGVLLGAAAQQSLGDAARDELATLRDQTGETVLLGHLVGTSVLYTEQLESPHQIRYAAPTHVRRPMLTTSMGKLFLSEMDLRRVRRIVASQAPEGEVDLDALLEELAQVRSRGYAVNQLPMQDGITALAAGVRAPDGHLAAAIAVRGPSFRISDDEVERFADLLQGATERVGQLLARVA